MMPIQNAAKPRKGRIVKRIIKLNKSQSNDNKNCKTNSEQPIKVDTPNIVKLPSAPKEAEFATKPKEDKPINPPIAKQPCISQPPIVTPYPIQSYPMIPQYSPQQVYPYYPQVPYYPSFPQYQSPPTPPSPQTKTTQPKIKVTQKQISKIKKLASKKFIQKKKIRRMKHSFSDKKKKDSYCHENKVNCSDETENNKEICLNFNKCKKKCEEECKGSEHSGEKEEDCKNVDFCKTMCQDLEEELSSEDDKSNKSETENSIEEDKKCVNDKEDIIECDENTAEESKDETEEDIKNKCIEDCNESNKDKCKEDCNNKCESECKKKCESEAIGSNDKCKEACLVKCDDKNRKDCETDCKKDCESECSKKCDNENECENNSDDKMEEDDFINCDEENSENKNEVMDLKNTEKEDFFITNSFKYSVNNESNLKNGNEVEFKNVLNKFCKKIKHSFCHNKDIYNSCKRKSVKKLCLERKNYKSEIQWDNCKEKNNKIKEKVRILKYFKQCLNHELKLFIKKEKEKEFENRIFDKITNIFMTLSGVNKKQKTNTPSKEYFGRSFIIKESPKKEKVGELDLSSKENCISEFEEKNDPMENEVVISIKNKIISDIMKKSKEILDSNPEYTTEAKKKLFIDQIREVIKNEIKNYSMNKNDDKPMLNKIGEQILKISKIIESKKTEIGDALIENKKSNEEEKEKTTKTLNKNTNDKVIPECKEDKKESKEDKNIKPTKDCKEICKENTKTKDKCQENKPKKHKKEKPKEAETICEGDSSTTSSSISDEQEIKKKSPKKKSPKQAKIPAEANEKPTFIPDFKFPNISLPKLQLPSFYDFIPGNWTPAHYEDNLFINETPNIPSDNFVPISRYLSTPQKVPQYISEQPKLQTRRIPTEKELLEKYGYKEISKEEPNIVEINRNIPLEEENNEKEKITEDKIKFLNSFIPENKPNNNLIEENDDKHVESDYEHNLEILKNDINNLKNSQIHKKFNLKEQKNNKQLKDAYENGTYVIKNANLKQKKDNLIIFSKKDLDCINSMTTKPKKDQGKKIIYLSELLNSQ